MFAGALDGIELVHEPHIEFKKRVPHAIGLIRTGDTTPIRQHHFGIPLTNHHHSNNP